MRRATAIWMATILCWAAAFLSADQAKRPGSEADNGDALLIQEALRQAPAPQDDYPERQVERDPAGLTTVVWLSTGSRLGDGFLVAFEKRRIVSKAATSPLYGVTIATFGSGGSVVLSREVTGSGTGYHQETMVIRDGKDLEKVVWRRVTREWVEGPYPEATRTLRRLHVRDGEITEFEVVEEGRQNEAGEFLWNEPATAIRHYTFDAATQEFRLLRESASEVLFAP